MSKIIAIDPGSTDSAYVIIDQAGRTPLEFGKLKNEEMAITLSEHLRKGQLAVAIELIGHYGTGMPAGKDVFDTCRWIGRYEQICNDRLTEPTLIKRATVKAHLCGVARAKDGNVIQALVDRFTPGHPNRGKGTKSNPGWFHGFHADIWQAYALAVYLADQSPAMGGLGPTAWPDPASGASL